MLKEKKRMKQNRRIKKAGILIGSATCLAALEIRRELGRFRVRRYRISDFHIHLNSDTDTNALERDMRIVFLSDLHGKVYGKENKSLLEAVRAEQPDLILVGGDMVIRGNEETVIKGIEFMQKLAQIGTVYCANGNHEQKMKADTKRYGHQYEVYKTKLQEAGVHLLENDSADLEILSLPITITGLELPLSCYGHFKEYPLRSGELGRLIGRCDKNRYQILLAHNPVYMKQYKDWGADLTLSGHLHGGIVRLPLLGGLITPQVKLFPKYSGDMYCEDGHCGIVSRGLGTHTVNIRLFNMAELVSITLEK